MDLKAYYRKIREIEDGITEDDVIVVSLETPDGGKAGVKMEVSRRQGARAVVEGRARLASSDEAEEYREESKQASERARQQTRASQIKVAILPESELKPKKTSPKAAR